jgi:hypothetical protein
MTDRPDPAKPAGQTGGQTGSQTGGTATRDSAASAGQSMADTARRTASDATGAARDMAAEQTERAKGAVADEVSSVAHALRTAADDLREGSAQERTFAQIADTLADAAETIRGKDLGEMVQEATEIARRHPMTFLGGAALLGFTAVRFAKASRDDADRRRPAYRTAGTRPGVTPTPTEPTSPEVARARRAP